MFIGAFLLSLLNNIYAAPVSFRRAVELAAAKSSVGVIPETNLGQSGQACVSSIAPLVSQIVLDSVVDYSPGLQMYLVDADSMSNQQVLNELALRPLQQGAHQKCQTEESVVSSMHRSVTLIAAIEYVQLSWVSLQLKVLKQEHETAVRMVAIEKMRVVVGVDEDVSLIRARLLEAQSRARVAVLESEELELREDLSYLTGLPDDQIETIPGSVPPLRVEAGTSASGQTIQPHCYIVIAKLQASVKELAAARDAAQLTYLLVERDAIRTAGLGKATLRKELASQVGADEKFVALLDATCELQMAQFELLDSIGKFENWAVSVENDKPALLQRHSDDKSIPMTHTRKSGTSLLDIAVAQASVKTILLLPYDETLKVRECRQLAAVAIGSDRRGKDATSVVRWSSSNESVAIVSTSGLITGLRPGHVVISATLAGVSQFIPITVGEEEPILKK